MNADNYNYFDLLEQKVSDDGSVLFTVKLNPDCSVYQGHFPGNPVCPGVCNINMIRRCIEHYTNKKLIISDIKQCRFTALITPIKQSILNLKAVITEAEDGYNVNANLYDSSTNYIEMKCMMYEEP